MKARKSDSLEENREKDKPGEINKRSKRNSKKKTEASFRGKIVGSLVKEHIRGALHYCTGVKGRAQRASVRLRKAA